MAISPIDVAEAGYAPQSDLAAWLRTVGPLVLDLMGPSPYGMAYLISHNEVSNVCVLGQAVDSEEGPHVLSSAVAETPPEILHAVLQAARHPGVHSLVDLLGRFPPAAAETPFPDGDSIALTFPFDATRSVVIGNMQADRVRISKEQARLMRQVSVHLASGARMVGRTLSIDAPDVAAALTMDGRVEHISSDLASRTSIQELQETAAAMKFARSVEGRRDPILALALWSNLLAGKWSLVDYRDTDGKSFILARRNAPSLPSLSSALNLREGQVAFYVIAGWTNYEIGYALGLKEGTVAGHLNRALQKLHLSSRSELIQIGSSLVRSAYEAISQDPIDGCGDTKAPSANLPSAGN